MADKTKLAFDEIKEENIVAEGGDRHFCDRCILPIHREKYTIALYLCFTCCKYFCVECFRNHDTNHNFVRRVREQREIDSEIDRIGNEGDIVEPENVCVCDWVYVKHKLDKKDKCFITGLCGADYRSWVACDYWNFCIKIFQFGTNVLLRYLRIGSKPWDVTEIQLKQNSAFFLDSASSSSSDISGTNHTKPDKQCLLAVTVPKEHHILLIDINTNPAFIVKSIYMGKRCFSIEYSEDTIFTVCNNDLGSYRYPWCVYAMSTDGVKLTVIQTDMYIYRPDLAVLPGRVYLIDERIKKVKCLNAKDIFKSENEKVKLVNANDVFKSEIQMKWLWPYGISVDPDNNVYVSTDYFDNNVYKLDMDLTGSPRPLLDPSTGYIRDPQTMCFYRNKLFIGHVYSNIVSVVRLVSP